MKEKRDLFQVNLMAILGVIGWNQADLARCLGVTRQSVSNWVRQKTDMPYVAYIAAMHVISTIGLWYIDRCYPGQTYLKRALLFRMTGYPDFDQPHWLYLDYQGE